MPLYNPTASTDATLTFTDVTTNNSSTSKHGFLKKLDNVGTNFMDGTGGWSVPGGTGSVASDAIWDAAGDLAVGTGANTAAKLVLGAAGGAVSRVNGAVAWNSGTSMPTAATGDRYWRTDLGLEFYYDGTRWLCTCPHSVDVATQHALLVVSATNSHRAAAPEAITSTIWLTNLTVGIYVTTTNDGTKYWTVGLNGIGTPASTVSLAPDTVHLLTSTLDTVFTIATTKWFQVDYTKVSTAGTAYPLARIGFRYIGT
jgi:hypothetical protein